MISFPQKHVHLSEDDLKEYTDGGPVDGKGKKIWAGISQCGVSKFMNDSMYHRLLNMDMALSEAFECNYQLFSAFYRRSFIR